MDWTALLEQRALVPDSEVASPVAVPQVRPSPTPPRQRRGLLHGAVAVAVVFSVVASAAVVISLWKGNEDGGGANEPAPAAVRAPVRATTATPPASAPVPPATSTSPPVAAATAVPAAVPAAPTPAPPSTPVTTAAAEPAAEKEPADEPARQRRVSHRRSHSSSGTKPTTRSEPEAKSESGSEPRSEEKEPAAGSESTNLVEPTAKDVAKAVDSIKSSIEACGKQHGVNGLGKIRLQVEPDGSVAWAAIREGGEAFQSCVERLFRGVRLPRSQRGGTFIHTVTLP